MFFQNKSLRTIKKATPRESYKKKAAVLFFSFFFWGGGTGGFPKVESSDFVEAQNAWEARAEAGRPVGCASKKGTQNELPW